MSIKAENKDISPVKPQFTTQRLSDHQQSIGQAYLESNWRILNQPIIHESINSKNVVLPTSPVQRPI